MPAHRMHLRGPWQISIRDELSGDFATPSTIKLPVTQEAFTPFRGRQVRLSRQFQKPTGLGIAERVWLVFEPVWSPGKILLNGEDLGHFSEAHQPREWDITALIQPRNLLVVERFEVGMLTPVALEIRSPD